MTEDLSVGFARIEGHLAVLTEKITNMQDTVKEMKESGRQDRTAFGNALRDHVDDVNPHPNQEAWLRTTTDGHSKRLSGLEADMLSRKAVYALLVAQVGLLLSIAGLALAYLK